MCFLSFFSSTDTLLEGIDSTSLHDISRYPPIEKVSPWTERSGDGALRSVLRRSSGADGAGKYENRRRGPLIYLIAFDKNHLSLNKTLR